MKYDAIDTTIQSLGPAKIISPLQKSKLPNNTLIAVHFVSYDDRVFISIKTKQLA
jgi:hypothetical protein